jgi:hypothetical protein
VYYTMNGKTHGNYWLIATEHFQVMLKREYGGQKPAAQTAPARIPAAQEDKAKIPDDGPSSLSID